ALIAEYQRSPQIGPLGDFAGERAEDATSASYTELPASYKPAPRRKPGHGRPGTGPGPGPAPGSRPGAKGGRQGSGWRRWLRAHMAWAGGAPAPKTVCGSSGHAGGGPDACMVKLSQGTADAAWLVQASGFESGQPV